MAFVTSYQSSFVPLFWDRQTAERRLCYRAMVALLVVQNYLTTDFLAQVYIATLRPTDIGRRFARSDPSSGTSSRQPVVF